jgi:hypothetical protein
MSTIDQTFPLSRRALLFALGASALAAPAQAQAQAYSRITADASRLRELGLGPYAREIEANLARSLARAFAGRTGVRGAPALLVRITGVQLSSYAGGEGGDGFRFGGGGSSSDYMDGEALVLDGRRVLSRHPQLATLPSSSGGAWYGPQNEQRRTAALCDHYAGWLARAL